MASIKGYEVKGVKLFPDHEGAMIPYGNLYFKNKKVGEFRADSWGGPMIYDHTSKTISEEEVVKGVLSIPEQLGWDSFYKNFDIIIEELVNFKEDEKKFKKLQKKDKYLCIYEQDRTKSFGTSFVPCVHYSIPSVLDFEEQIKKVQEIEQEKHPGGVVRAYRTLEDFIIQ